MSIDELWNLHEEVSTALASRLARDKEELERRLVSLRPAPDRAGGRRPYPPVFPKYANPDEPQQVWSGRGKQPRWVAAKLAAGLSLRDLRIAPDRSGASMPSIQIPRQG
jgi:DNA-binding protein H-NS